ncbi:MAG: hypothetical protein IJM64_03020 [Ottowia sp.]|nr:hypothetical protein [Ottowia sp.]
MAVGKLGKSAAALHASGREGGGLWHEGERVCSQASAKGAIENMLLMGITSSPVRKAGDESY